jgi:hypothetical protein
MLFQRAITIILALIVITLPEFISAQTWQEITTGSGAAPTARRNAAAIFDPVNHRMILFAGRAASGDQNDVWSLDLNTNLWSDITPASGSAPAPRFTPNAVYDAIEQQMIIWSGQGVSFYNDVWAFDLANETWSEFTPPDPKPNIRYGTAAVFDPLARDLVTFAGFTDQGRFDDTWRFDVENAAWMNVTPAQGNPIERCLHSASYDSLNHRMIMYGGQQSGPLGDIWAFDLTQNLWTELTPANSPPGRYFATNIYDDRSHRVIIFGGNRGSNGGVTNEVWAFNLAANTWEQLLAAGNPPPSREGAAAIYIRAEDRMVIFGGREANFSLLNDAWSLKDLSPSTGIGSDDSGELISGYVLFQNYPNPFNPTTNIGFRILDFGFVSLKVYDVFGRKVATLVNESKTAGSYTIEFDAGSLAGGTYFYHLESGDFQQVKKMLLLK